MKFIDINKRNSPAKLNLITLIFALIAISGIFFSLNDSKSKKESKGKQHVEKLQKIASDTTLKNIDVRYKTIDPGKFANSTQFSQNKDYSKKFYQAMITVVILFVLFLLVVYLLKKRTNIKFGNNDNIKILGRKYLGQKQFIATVKVDGEKLLLGVTGHSINLLRVIDSNQSKSEDTKETIEEQEESFPRVLGKIKKS